MKNKLKYVQEKNIRTIKASRQRTYDGQVS